MKKDEIICQNCKYHKNKPSRCLNWKDVFNQKEPLYVPRKAKCERYERIK